MKAFFFSAVVLLLGLQVEAALPTKGLPEDVSNLYKAMYASDCEIDNVDTPFEAETHNIIKDVTLYLVPCFSGAYNVTQVGFVRQHGTLLPLFILDQEPSMKNLSAAIVTTPYLVNAGYDAKTKTLGTFTKGRGVGDCGSSSTTKFLITPYGSLQIRTIEIRHKEQCDGEVEKDWPVVFKQ